ncbi:SDR family NAD(P)-dependent oxidoreductase [uncultured Aeromicrobium sp.]|uniref:SDR family NAD(P)-dependent oxidoreductase n=1 Tax=uncultured Aeromicrobium sp. TaxID=337820 RepID=UPI0025E49571|nr:SDR family NAD(P)-dependent oxidoreductase [uncultured Aeromicrobium sp.]
MTASRSIVITGASSGFGNRTAKALARAGHTVYARMRETTGRNAPRVAELAELSATEGIDIRGIEMDVQDQNSVDAAIARIAAEQDRLDPEGHEVNEVAEEIVRVIGLPASERPFRVHVDPSKGGSEVVSDVYDRIRAEFYHRIGTDELLTPQATV